MQNPSMRLPSYIYHLLYRNYDISFCLCAGLKQLQLIPQVDYVNNVISYNNNSYAIRTTLICIGHSCKWHEISDR